MRQIIKNSIAGVAVAFLTASTAFCGPVKNFSIEGKGIRNTIVANVDGKSVYYSSEQDGAVSAYTIDGKKLWRNSSDKPATMFEIIAKDIDGDKNDDLIAAGGSGSIYAWKSNGELLWKFTPEATVRFSEVATIGSGKECKIFAAGNNYIMYELNSKGEKISETTIDGVVRKLESGKFIDNNEILFLFTLKHDKFRSQFFGFIDPVTKKVLKKGDIASKEKGSEPILKSGMVTDMSVADVNKDGKDELLLFATDAVGEGVAFDGDLKVVARYRGWHKDRQRYAHAVGCALMPVKDQIVMQYGGGIYTYSLDGKMLKRSGVAHEGIIYNDLVVEPSTKTLIGAGQIGGDNTLYHYDLTKANWIDTKQEFGGLYKEVKDNLATLYSQTLKFKLPDYQTKKEKDFRILGIGSSVINDKDLSKLDGGNLTFISTSHDFSEDTDRSDLVAAIGKDALKRDKRRKYADKREDIVAWAKEQEKLGVPFQLWVGHGTDPFFIRLETLEQIIAAAPTMCYGFIYAEMAEADSPSSKHFVDVYMPRIAAAIKKYNAPTKIYFRYKNMFWAADCHEETWRKLFFSNKYNDILVPSAEDTNNRLQDLNFAGRVGMFASGYVNDYAMRLVDDNPTSWRPLAPGGQRSVSPYLRNGVIMAAYGSRHGILFPIKYLEDPGYNILFALMKSGVIPVVEKEDILSIGSWHLIKDIDAEYLAETNNGHDLCKYSPEDDNAVVANAGVQWCGMAVKDWDFSKIAMGVDYRWLNFMPKMPNGMVAITSDKFASTLDKTGGDYFTSNIHKGYENGKWIDGKDFGTTMKNVVEKGGKKLLMRVDGASWALIRIDKNHARLVVVDPGYIDPAKTDAKITFQNMKPKKGVDILSGEKISTKNGEITISVPAGSMRFIDFEYSSEI